MILMITRFYPYLTQTSEIKLKLNTEHLFWTPNDVNVCRVDLSKKNINARLLSVSLDDPVKSYQMEDSPQKH